MKATITRKRFIQLGGVGAIALGLPKTSYANAKQTIPSETDLKIGLASYSLRKFSIEQTIDMTQQLGLSYLCLKSMHMPLDSSEESIQKIAEKVRKADIDLYAAGVIYMKTEDDVRNAFQYAAHAGLRVIVGVPNYELLPIVEEQVQQYDIKLAIHNHGPGDDVYPGPDTIYEKVKDLDKRVGICMDIGHTRRIEQDPAKMALKYAERLHDVHLKDVDKTGAEGECVEFGRGIVDMPAFLKAMKKIQYDGILSLEYEKDPDAPMLGLAESVGYSRGILATLAGEKVR